MHVVTCNVCLLMRIMELMILCLVLLLVAGHYIPLKRSGTFVNCLSLAAALLVPLHLLVEGYRWQMVPVYLFTLVYIIGMLVKTFSRSERRPTIGTRVTRTVLGVFFSIFLMISILFPALLPVVDLPEPAGPYPVGRTQFRMIDPDREELFTADPADQRTLLVTAWYPSEEMKRSTLIRYWDREGITGRKYSLNAGMGTFWYSHLSLVKTNSYMDASFAMNKNAFPVILYSHSFYGLNTENTMLLEELASNGYIIFSIAHSYENIVSVFPDGEVISGDLSHISGLYDSNAEWEAKLYEDYRQADQRDEKVDLTKRILVVDELSTNLLRIRTEDVLFVLNELERLNENSGIFRSRLDLGRIGIMGWSFGGATAMEACIADDRFRAGVNMDGTPYGELFNAGGTIDQPFMVIRSESLDEMEEIISGLVFRSMKGPAFIFTIQGAMHSNFWDFPLFFRIYRRLGYWGPIDPIRMLDINGTMIQVFFDKHLQGMAGEPNEEISDRFPEVSLVSSQSSENSLSSWR